MRGLIRHPPRAPSRKQSRSRLARAIHVMRDHVKKEPETLEQEIERKLQVR